MIVLFYHAAIVLPRLQTTGSDSGDKRSSCYSNRSCRFFTDVIHQWHVSIFQSWLIDLICESYRLPAARQRTGWGLISWVCLITRRPLRRCAGPLYIKVLLRWIKLIITNFKSRSFYRLENKHPLWWLIDFWLIKRHWWESTFSRLDTSSSRQLSGVLDCILPRYVIPCATKLNKQIVQLGAKRDCRSDQRAVF